MDVILEQLETHTQNKPNDIALHIDDETITYSQLNARITSAVESLQKYSLNPVVAINMKSPVQSIICYLALHRLHKVPMMMEGKWQSTIHRQLIEKYGIKDVIGDTCLMQNIDSPMFIDSTQLQHYPNLLHIGFTSGTTGLPKAYYRDEDSWLASFEVNEMLMLKNENAIAAPGPLSHSLTLYALLFALSSGRTFIGQTTFHPERLLNQCRKISSYKVAMFLVPTMIKSLLLVYNNEHTIQSFFSSGDKLHSSIFKKIKNQANDINLIEFFGTSKTSFISYNLNQQAPVESVGVLFPNVELKTTNHDHNGIGTICVKSNMMFSGYVSEQCINNDEWFVTNDNGYVKEQYLYLTGRQHDMLIIGGQNIYPAHVERLLTQSSSIDEAIIIGIPNERFGQIGVLLYSGDVTLTHKNVKQFLNKKVKRYEIPSMIHHVEKMYYTASGKIAREKMMSMYLRGEL
ncbi:TPA: AMP-binding protein [Staphylococcus aureus]|uniref:AMP-binding protein n=1 Tax=Staphylococcus aureus TaxID=1280 RepID=UPI00077C6319|nr:AMP-binding protein [Staphylococcus aureus]MCG5689336.1 AMP-binding protein [Staphylococcus aureus]UMT62566.1 AMP-binding protein [Staphylococcus aureus]WJA47539.1 AMP-binding protein [Staphylococcus aureus]WJA92340.1 AMP-binding protein [Staphylococcus aureus]WJC64958.1 AMP-binding protein [Staphylococcus aureus]